MVYVPEPRGGHSDDRNDRNRQKPLGERGERERDQKCFFLSEWREYLRLKIVSCMTFFKEIIY